MYKKCKARWTFWCLSSAMPLHHQRGQVIKWTPFIGKEQLVVTKAEGDRKTLADIWYKESCVLGFISFFSEFWSSFYITFHHQVMMMLSYSKIRDDHNTWLKVINLTMIILEDKEVKLKSRQRKHTKIL